AHQNRWEELLATLSEITPPLPDHLRELGGIALIKLQRFTEAIAHYKAWLEDHPTHKRLRQRLAGLYAKVGNREAAEKVLWEEPPSRPD
ncbi:MAG: tetratricopeptide repeat protein, partial [Candidatus Neomarinimicrobiota bacterium]